MLLKTRLKQEINKMVADRSQGLNGWSTASLSSADASYAAYCDLCDAVYLRYSGDRFDYQDAVAYLADQHGINIDTHNNA